MECCCCCGCCEDKGDGAPPTVVANESQPPQAPAPHKMERPEQDIDLTRPYEEEDVIVPGEAHASSATIFCPSEATIGSTIDVAFTGPKNSTDFIAVAKVGKKNEPYINYSYVNDGNSVELLMPSVAGDYEIKYMLEPHNKVLAKIPIVLVEAHATIACPSEAMIGSTINVMFTGPKNSTDFIAVGKVGKKNEPYINYSYVGGGSSVELLMPSEAGEYEIKYMMEPHNKVINKVPIVLLKAEATIACPGEATIGSTIEVKFTGPKNSTDFIAIAKVGKKKIPYINYSYVSGGDSVELLMPSEAGDYEIKYMLEPQNKVLAKIPIVVLEAQATIACPSEAMAGSTIDVKLTGPKNRTDFIAVAKVGQKNQPYINYSYVSGGDSVELLMPAEVGDYEIKYMLETDNKVITKIPIVLVKAEATIACPGEATIGSTIEVKFTGPKNSTDFIAVAKVGRKNEPYLNYSYVSGGDSVELLMPSETGNYEVKYMLETDNKVIAKLPIVLVEAHATIICPSEATVGSTIDVRFTGPKNSTDFIAVAQVGRKSEPYINYSYVSGGDSVELLMPSKAGNYEIKYMLETDNRVVAKIPIVLVEAHATIFCPNQATVGSTIEVKFTGPKNSTDFIAIGKVGKKNEPYINYSYVSGGDSVELLMPSEAGDYDIKYMLEADNKVIAQIPIVLV